MTLLVGGRSLLAEVPGEVVDQHRSLFVVDRGAIAPHGVHCACNSGRELVERTRHVTSAVLGRAGATRRGTRVLTAPASNVHDAVLPPPRQNATPSVHYPPKDDR